MRGVKNIATKAPGYGPFANFASNPSQDKSLHFIEGVVPKLAEGFNTGDGGVPFDAAYVHWGDASPSPYWMSSNSGTNQAIAQWDASDKRLYRRLGNAGGQGELGAPLGQTNFNYWHPLGYCGEQTQFAPKNPNAQRVVFGSRLRFVDNVDYAGLGWGCGAAGGANYTGTGHSFNVTRSGAGKWRVYSMDGATRSFSDSTEADDGNWHDFTVVWSEAALTLYVDNVAVITKTTNLPTRPLHPWVAGDNTHRLDIVDWRGYWEGD